jgi:glycosyltransferase involved in cell wall biosynthesis
MRCPTLKELPPPPADKSGWPWTEETPPLPSLPATYPCISIITPSYNQGQFIEETIRSVLLQGYPDLDYIIMDAGSTDETLSIIRKYEPWLSSWVSEPDRGQSDAINKGFRRAQGEILAWNNSDDTYEKGALVAIATLLVNQPQTDVVYGNAKVVDERGQKIWELRSVPFHPQAFFYRTVHIAAQSAVFWRRELFFKVGMLNEDLKYAMDVDLLIRFVENGANFKFLRRILGTYRCHSGSKTFGTSEESVAELCTLPTLLKLRQRPDYQFWCFVYRLRQSFLLLRQGDLNHLFLRLLKRL